MDSTVIFFSAPSLSYVRAVPAKKSIVVLLFASQLNPLANGGMDNVDMQYSFFRLGSTSSISISKEDSQVLDSVSFDLSYPNILGYSLQTNTLNSNDNNNPDNWCTPTSDYGDGDFGTPGLVNNPCP